MRLSLSEATLRLHLISVRTAPKIKQQMLSSVCVWGGGEQLLHTVSNCTNQQSSIKAVPQKTKQNKIKNHKTPPMRGSVLGGLGREAEAGSTWFCKYPMSSSRILLQNGLSSFPSC